VIAAFFSCNTEWMSQWHGLLEWISLLDCWTTHASPSGITLRLESVLTRFVLRNRVSNGLHQLELHIQRTEWEPCGCLVMRAASRLHVVHVGWCRLSYCSVFHLRN